MNGSTRTCIAVLNAFSLFLLIAAGADIYFVVSEAANSTTDQMIVNVGTLLSMVVVAALLRAASEALRLLDEISTSLWQPRARGATHTSRAA